MGGRGKGGGGKMRERRAEGRKGEGREKGKERRGGGKGERREEGKEREGGGVGGQCNMLPLYYLSVNDV